MAQKGVSPELGRRGSRHLEASSSTSSSSSSLSARRLKKRDQLHCRDSYDDADHIECSGRGCKSCTTGTVADCVAVCFCPCAVVHFLTLALVKVPYSVGKKCVGLGKKRKQRRVEKAKMMAFNAENVSVGGSSTDSRSGGAADEEEDETSAEMVWMEMGQLGFGRMSFHGIQSLGNNNLRNS